MHTSQIAENSNSSVITHNVSQGRKEADHALTNKVSEKFSFPKITFAQDIKVNIIYNRFSR